MPRPRSNHHLVSSPQSQPQSSHQTSAMYSQHRNDPQVQRSQGVIFLSTNKPQVPPPQPPAPAPPAHSHLAHQVNQVPAHHASMFQSQHVPAFVPTSLMQNPFFPYYHPIPAVSSVAANEVYTPNGGNLGGGYDQSMQVPPSPMRNKTKRRSRYTGEESDSSSEEEFNDDEEDPDWNPQANEEVTDPMFENRHGSPRGRRTSTTPRGRGGGGGRGRGSRGGGRGRGRGRGRGNLSGLLRTDIPPTLVDQSAQMRNQLAGRQTRSTLSMPALDPQSGQLSFGELVSAAVQSLNEPENESYPSARGHNKKQKQLMAAVIVTQPNKTILIERVAVSSPASIFVLVDMSEQGSDQQNKDELALEAEDEDLIMAYEIVQEEDKKRHFLCEVCGKESRSRVLHNRHLVTHAPSLSFACCICSQLFESHEKLKPHLRMHHGSGIYVCPEMDCEGVFQERKSLDDHDFACHPNARPFLCRFCLDRFPTTADALAHEDGHDEDITASCLKCSSTYKTKTDLKNHYSHMHEEKQCKYCEEKFENQPTLDEHLNEVHPEKLKPPTPPPEPEPSPEPIADDDPMPSPAGADDDDDDIVVVEEKKKVTPVKPIKKPENRKSINKRPEPKAPPARPTPTPPRPGPKSKSILKPKPSSAPSDIITLSSDSDDEKDPEWAPGGKRSRKSYLPASPIKRPSRKKAEYVIVVESRTEEPASDVLKKASKSTNEHLTFVMGDSGELVHVPTASDPHPPDSLPIKEILEVIKNKKLTDNTTIVIEDNKISAVRPGSSQKSSRPGPLSKTSSITPLASSSKKLVRPHTESTTTNKPGTSDGHRRPLEHHSKPKSSNLVAKKRTGGIPRTDKNDKGHKSYDLPSSSTSSTSERDKIKPKPTVVGPIAKKRTGGSSSIYDKIKQKSDQREDFDLGKSKHSRKEAHNLREEYDDDEPILVEDRGSSYKPIVTTLKSPVKSSSSSSHKKKSKRGRKKGSKSARRQESVKQQLQADQAFDELADLPADYDHAPKRSLRIALKASVADAASEEDSQSSPIGLDDPIADDDDYRSMPNSNKKRGRPSTRIQSNHSSSPSTPAGGYNSNAIGESSTSSAAASNGQVVMKALVNGKWQDVVIGTKLANEHEPVQASSSKIVPSTSRMEKIPKQVNAKKSTGGKRKQAHNPAKIAPPSRSGRKGASRKGKNSKKAADCWRDDRYQYFSDGSRTAGRLDPSAHLYNVPDSEPIQYKDDTDYDGLSQEYGADGDDTVMPFSLSSYMTYHQDDSLQTMEAEPDPEPEDHGMPVIVSAYHVDASRDEVSNYNNHDSYVENSEGMYKGEPSNDHEGDEAEDLDEIPLRDPLAMDMDDGASEEHVEEDPLGGHEAPSQPLRVVEPVKGTPQDAKSAISNLRSVLSQITFKR